MHNNLRNSLTSLVVIAVTFISVSRPFCPSEFSISFYDLELVPFASRRTKRHRLKSHKMLSILLIILYFFLKIKWFLSVVRSGSCSCFAVLSVFGLLFNCIFNIVTPTCWQIWIYYTPIQSCARRDRHLFRFKLFRLFRRLFCARQLVSNRFLISMAFYSILLSSKNLFFSHPVIPNAMQYRNNKESNTNDGWDKMSGDKNQFKSLLLLLS